MAFLPRTGLKYRTVITVTFEDSTNGGIYDESLGFVLLLTQFMFQLLMKKTGQTEKSFPIASCNPEVVLDTEVGVGLVSIRPQVDDRLSVPRMRKRNGNVTAHN